MNLWCTPMGVSRGIVRMTHVVRLASSFKVIFVRTEEIGAASKQSSGMQRAISFELSTICSRTSSDSLAAPSTDSLTLAWNQWQSADTCSEYQALFTSILTRIDIVE